jgi:hypothetical protein
MQPQYHLPDRVHRLDVLVVDFDGGSVGEKSRGHQPSFMGAEILHTWLPGTALLTAAGRITGPSTLPTYRVMKPESTTEADLIKMVHRGKAWGAIWANEGATRRFLDAVASQDAASAYVPANALSYTGLEVRYNTVGTTLDFPMCG